MQLSMQKPSKQYNLCHRGERQSMPPLISSEYLWMELLSIALTIRYPFGHTTEICSLLHQFSIESLHHIFDYDYGFFLAEVKIIVKTKTED